jgi:hypothetical protein
VHSKQGSEQEIAAPKYRDRHPSPVQKPGKLIARLGFGSVRSAKTAGRMEKPGAVFRPGFLRSFARLRFFA